MCRFFLCFLLGITVAYGQPVNDHRSNATVISGTNVFVTGSNDGATEEPGDPQEIEGGTFPTGGVSVWWKWTPTSNGDVTIATGLEGGTPQQNSNFDTQLGVYVLEGSTLREITSSEDAPELSFEDQGGLSQVTFNATSGTTYFIMVNGWEGDTGTIRLHLNQVTQSHFTLSLSANPIAGGSFSVSPTSPNLTFPQGTPVTITANPASNFVFLSWMGDAQGTTNPVTVIMNNSKQVGALFSNVNTGFQLVVNATGGGSVRIDPPPNAANGSYATNTRVLLTAIPDPERQFFSWSGTYSSTNNPFQIFVHSNLTFTAHFGPAVPPPNDDFENAILLEGTNVMVSAHNFNSTMQIPPEPLDIDGVDSSGRSLWWRWVAPSSGRTTISTGLPTGVAQQQSSFDTLLGVFTGSTRSNLNPVATNDDHESLPFGLGLSLVEFDAVGGQNYYIFVDSFSGQMGEIRLYLENSSAPVVRPSLLITRQSESITLTATGSPGTIHQLQSSTNLLTWQFKSLITNSSGSISEPASDPARYYRLSN